MASARASFTGQRICWTLSAFGLVMYIFWGGPGKLPVIQTNFSQDHDPTAQPDNLPPAPVAPAAPTISPIDEFVVAPNGFWKGLGSTKGHVFDTRLAEAISGLFLRENISSILELGAGMGLYAKRLKSDGFFISCYDGNPDTQALSEGRCGVIDLSKPLDICPHDWVLSLEVGEHIPADFEANFLNNLDKGNRYGMVLSWAVEGQGGTSHVNNRNNNYIRETLYKLGYNSDFENERVLRDAATMHWFKGTLMVFRRRISNA